MNRKLTRKLVNTVQHQHQLEDEDGGAQGQHNSYSQPRRGNLSEEDDYIEAELAAGSGQLGRHQRPFDVPASNPFSYYDRANQSRTDLGSSERLPDRSPVPSSRLGASIVRSPSPIVQKANSDRWGIDGEDEIEEEDLDEEEQEEEQDYGSSASLRLSRETSRSALGGASKLTKKEKQVNLKKAGSSGQRGQSEDKKGTNGPPARKTNKSKEVNQGREFRDGSDNRRSRGGGSGGSLSGNGNYVTTNGSSRINRSGSVNPVRGNSTPAVSRHELPTLPIEIPEGVTDVDAFRRYLSVRRGAVGPLTHIPLPAFEDHNSDSVLESVAGGFGSGYGSSKTKHLNTSGGLAGAAAASLLVQRKSMALSHAIMTLALLSASASQLRFVVAYSNAHSYPALNYFLICSCIVVEIFVGIGYVIISRFEFSERTLDRTNSFLIFGLFFVAIANVIIASFALDDHVCEVLAVLQKQKEREQLQFDTIIDNTAPAVIAAHQSIA